MRERGGIRGFQRLCHDIPVRGQGLAPAAQPRRCEQSRVFHGYHGAHSPACTGHPYISNARYDDCYLLDDGYVRCEGANRGRVDGAHVIHGMEDRRGSEDAWIDTGLHHRHSSVGVASRV